MVAKGAGNLAPRRPADGQRREVPRADVQFATATQGMECEEESGPAASEEGRSRPLFERAARELGRLRTDGEAVGPLDVPCNVS